MYPSSNSVDREQGFAAAKSLVGIQMEIAQCPMLLILVLERFDVVCVEVNRKYNR
jgi:hypothetical protein